MMKCKQITKITSTPILKVLKRYDTLDIHVQDMVK